MREIKFRYVLRDKETKAISTMHYTLEDIEVGSIHTDFSVLGLIDRTKYDVVARRQYTGVKDPKGVEIYEGDIVLLDKMVLFDKYADRGDGSCDDVLAVTKDDLLAVTKWDDHYQGFMYKHLPETPESAEVFMFEYAAEVVGNIYENPELLTTEDN